MSPSKETKKNPSVGPIVIDTIQTEGSLSSENESPSSSPGICGGENDAAEITQCTERENKHREISNDTDNAAGWQNQPGSSRDSLPSTSTRSTTDELGTKPRPKKNNPKHNETEEDESDKYGLKIPLSRIRKIMRADPYLGIASQDAVFLVAKATELFIESLASEAYEITSKAKKKTVARKDIDTIIEQIESLAFLEGAIDY